MYIKADTTEQHKIKERLKGSSGIESQRLLRYLEMPDLTRKEGSPIKEMVDRFTGLNIFQDFDVIEVPEIVSAQLSFDLFDFPADHPVRSRSDTYYIDDKYILRTHTTVMWYYYLCEKSVKERMATGRPVGCFSFGKVYRKDEIDRNHMNVFHQIDGWYLVPRDQKVITSEDLRGVLASMARAIFGAGIQIRFNPDTFPYTYPSLEMEINKNGVWLEVAGAGVVKDSVLENFGVNSSKWNGWAFGPGLERLAMVSMDLPDIRLLWSDDPRITKQLVLGHKFREVSKYPPITRDISFIVGKDFVPNNYFDLVRDLGGGLVEEVKLLDKYEDDKKFGKDRMSYTYRIVYRSNDRTLVSGEVDEIQDELYRQTKEQFGAEIR